MNNKRDLISIIIPVYNVKEYLERCLMSIINQTYKDLEILIIDDGSSDGSDKICDDFAIRDNRIVVKHKKNEGVSAARNFGIEISKGKYLMFVDGDDWLENNFIEFEYKAIKDFNADIVVSRLIKSYIVSGNIINIKPAYDYASMVLSREKSIEAVLYSKLLSDSTCGNLFDKEIFRHIRFPYGKRYEDFATLYKLLDQSNKVIVIKKLGYHYFQRGSSFMHSCFSNSDLLLIDFAKEQLDFIIKKYPDLSKAAHCRFAEANVQLLWKLVLDKNKEFKPIKLMLYKNICLNSKYVLCNINSRLTLKIKIMIAILFGDWGIRLLDSLKTLKRN